MSEGVIVPIIALPDKGIAAFGLKPRGGTPDYAQAFIGSNLVEEGIAGPQFASSTKSKVLSQGLLYRKAEAPKAFDARIIHRNPL
ncbi:MAG: hypothetical protein II041_06190 [Bacteroidales bacterium]|nr:hypothetical protein [Bacteroidales bacterium]